MSVSVQVATPMHALRVGGQVYHYTSSPYHLKTRSLAGQKAAISAMLAGHGALEFTCLHLPIAGTRAHIILPSF